MPALSETLLFGPERPVEELYDYRADPWQITNLATDPKFRETLVEQRRLLDEKLKVAGDPAPETPEQYDSDMAEYLKKKNPVVEANIDLMKRWAAEGK